MVSKAPGARISSFFSWTPTVPGESLWNPPRRAVVTVEASVGGVAQLTIYVTTDKIKPLPLQVLLPWTLE